jgi:hypothetical protein
MNDDEDDGDCEGSGEGAKGDEDVNNDEDDDDDDDDVGDLEIGGASGGRGGMLTRMLAQSPMRSGNFHSLSTAGRRRCGAA